MTITLPLNPDGPFSELWKFMRHLGVDASHVPVKSPLYQYAVQIPHSSLDKVLKALEKNGTVVSTEKLTVDGN